MVSYVTCTDCENDKIWLTCHSSLSWLHMSCIRTVRTIKYDWQVIQVLWMFRMLHERTVSVERLMKWGKRGLDNEENVTDVKERNYNEKRQTRLSCKPLPSLSHFSNAPIIAMPHLPHVGQGWDYWGFTKVLWQFPTPGDNFMLQIPHILYRDCKNNENSQTNSSTLGKNYSDDKSLQIPTHCLTRGRWRLTMIGA